MHALEKANTWELIPLPKDKRAVGYKRVYSIKCRADGSMGR